MMMPDAVTMLVAAAAHLPAESRTRGYEAWVGGDQGGRLAPAGVVCGSSCAAATVQGTCRRAATGVRGHFDCGGGPAA
eukprot:scaffold4622_cov368-Prasinococcus_capsulatus_cf.AAC.1